MQTKSSLHLGSNNFIIIPNVTGAVVFFAMPPTDHCVFVWLAILSQLIISCFCWCSFLPFSLLFSLSKHNYASTIQKCFLYSKFFMIQQSTQLSISLFYSLFDQHVHIKRQNKARSVIICFLQVPERIPLLVLLNKIIVHPAILLREFYIKS